MQQNTRIVTQIERLIIIIIIMVYLQYYNKREALTTVNAIYAIKKK